MGQILISRFRNSGDQLNVRTSFRCLFLFRRKVSSSEMLFLLHEKKNIHHILGIDSTLAAVAAFAASHRSCLVACHTDKAG